MGSLLRVKNLQFDRKRFELSCAAQRRRFYAFSLAGHLPLFAGAQFRRQSAALSYYGGQSAVLARRLRR